MAYREIPRVLTEAPGTPEAEAAAREWLADVARRREFRILATAPAPPPDAPALPGLRLSGAQQYVQAFASPETPWARLLVCWQPGTGKSIAGPVSVGAKFIRAFRASAAQGGQGGAVVVVSFTARDTIQADMLRFPEFGYVSAAEAAELRRRRAEATAPGAGAAAARAFASYEGALRRRTTDASRGGFYRFYGYREFATRLFSVTARGAAAGFDPATLCARSKGSTFEERLDAARRRGDVALNETLLGELRHGLLVCDEIHNAYNSAEKNNYGEAIQYVLDSLGAAAPRAVFMSATPMTGSAAEVVDLLSLLVPRALLRAPLRRGDFFVRVRPGDAAADASTAAGASTAADADDDDADASASVALRPGALARIAHLAAGRVSFLLDSDVAEYPARRFEGEPLPGVPYLRFRVCPMSRRHEAAVDAAQQAASRDAAAPFAPDAQTLYDGVFPDPDGGPGLYRADAASRIAAAPEEWRRAEGVVVAPTAPGSPPDLAGDFLGPGRLAEASAKLAAACADAVAALEAPGKFIVFHPRVHGTGVILIAEALRAHGFADEEGAPTDATRCARCGVPRGAHGARAAAGEGARAPHEYAPARYVLVHGELDRAVAARSLARFNAPTNAEGYEYRACVGSRVIREGLNFFCARRLLVTGLPTDFPTLLQVFGRVSRRGSHAALPPAERDVRITVYVSTRAGAPPLRAPEAARYAAKGREYLVVQEVERALREYAVDGAAHAARVAAALGAPGADPAAAPPGLEGLPFAPAQAAPALAALADATYLAFDGAARTTAALAEAARALLRARPAWTPDALWAAARRGVGGLALDPALAGPGEFALALDEVCRRPAPGAPGVDALGAARAGPYVVATSAFGPDGAPRLDFECWGRAAAPAPAVRVPVAAYLREARAGAAYAARLAEFERAYLRGGRPLELSLVECSAAFHYALVRRLVLAAAGGPPATSADARVADLYRRFRVVLTAADAAAAGARAYRGAAGRRGAALVGAVAAEAVHLYDPSREEWYAAPLGDFGVGRRHAENNVVVGFVAGPGAGAPFGGDESGAAVSAAAHVKLRPPSSRLRAAPGVDARTLSRGAVCESRSRPELDSFLRALRAAVASAGLSARGLAAGRAPGDAGDDSGAVDSGPALFHLRPDGSPDVDSPVDDYGDLAAPAARAPPAPVAFADVRALQRGLQARAPPPAVLRQTAEEAAKEAAESPEAPAEAAETPAEAAALAAPETEPGQEKLGARLAARAQPQLAYAAAHDRAKAERFPTAGELCSAIRLHLLALEEHARAPADGMSRGVRWIYLFCDRQPNLATLAG